jgi:hypothetical protein
MAASTSTYSYHPDQAGRSRNTTSVWGAKIGYDMVTIVVKNSGLIFAASSRNKQQLSE